jgi:hypothetical protein
MSAPAVDRDLVSSDTAMGINGGRERAPNRERTAQVTVVSRDWDRSLVSGMLRASRAGAVRCHWPARHLCWCLSREVRVPADASPLPVGSVLPSGDRREVPTGDGGLLHAVAAGAGRPLVLTHGAAAVAGGLGAAVAAAAGRWPPADRATPTSASSGRDLLEVAGLVNDQRRLRSPRRSTTWIADVVAHRVLVPDGAGEQVLHPVGRGCQRARRSSSSSCGQVGQRPAHERPGVPSRLHAAVPARDPAQQLPPTAPATSRVDLWPAITV